MKKMFTVIIVLALVFAAVVFVASRMIMTREKGEYFDSAGVRIHYTDEGKGEPVILIHGFAVNADLNFRRPGITKARAREYRVISLDLRGHGLSGKPHGPEKYGPELWRDVIRLMDHLGIKKAHVAGYSLGGFITTRLAVDYQDRLITAIPMGAGWEQANSRFIRALPEVRKALLAGKGVGPLAKHLGPRRRKPGMMHTFWVGLMTARFNDGKALAALVPGMPELQATREELERIKIPILNIVGELDPFVDGARAMHEVVPDHELVVIKGADHLRAAADPELREAMLEFLGKHSEKKDKR